MAEREINKKAGRKRRGRKTALVPQAVFDNREYWETRYTTEPERGSGIGSRGQHLELKHRLLSDIIDEIQPRSILDVGCGDIEVVKGLQFPGSYTGIDLSPTIVERNKLVRPDWTFIQGDFVELARQNVVAADLVVCFDVLIHQHDPDVYRDFVRNLVAVTQRVLVVNGFENWWVRGKRQAACAFHEPLSETIAALGPYRTVKLGRFRGTRIYRVDKDAPGDEPAGS